MDQLLLLYLYNNKQNQNYNSPNEKNIDYISALIDCL